jgi:hypothetical protein
MTMSAEEAREQFELAAQLYADQRYDEAAAIFGTLFLEPEALEGTAEMHWNYAMCLAHLDQWPLAIEHVRAGGYDEAQFREAARQSNIRDAAHDYEQADAMYQAGDYRGACDAFAALLLHPGYPADQLRLMHWNMAMCFAHMDDFHTAIEHIRAGQWSEDDFREAAVASGLEPPAVANS